MKNQTSNKIRTTKYIVFVIGIIFNILLVIFPNLIPEEIKDRVLITFIMSSIIGLFFAFEEMKLIIQEHNEEIDLEFKKMEKHLIIDEIYQSLLKIEEIEDNIFRQQTHNIFLAFKSSIKKAENGFLSINNIETATIVNQLANSIKTSLKATMLWDKSPITGQFENEYLTKLASAIKNGVLIQRLFIIQPGIENDIEFKNRIKQDLKNGVKVKYLYVSDWTRSQNAPYPIDFGIWDEQRVWVFSNDNSNTPNERHALLHKSEAEVASFRNIFESNWEYATNIDNLEQTK